MLSSQKTVTTTASSLLCSSTFKAPRKFAPDEMPTPRPSSRASFCAIRIASPSSTAMISSRKARSRIGGTNSSEIPWMRCLPTLHPADSVGELAGSSGWIFTPGTDRFRKRPTPMTVPPVPTPAMNASGFSPCSRSCQRSSGPVVASCAAQLSSFENCRGRKAPFDPAHSSARRMLPRKPPSAWLTRWMSAPKLRIKSIRSRLIQSGMKIVTGWPVARPTPASAMPVFPLVASAIGCPGARRPAARARSKMWNAIRSLMLPVKLMCSAFA